MSREDAEITSFCHYVHFFRSPETAQPWLNEHPGTFLLTVAEAFEVGRRRNRLLYTAVAESFEPAGAAR